MAAKVSRIDGLTEVNAALAALPEAFREVVAQTFEVGGVIIEGEADARVPVDEGDLKASLGRNTREDGLQVTVGSGDPKARWVEFSTIDTPAQPFLWPGFRIGARFVRKQMRLSWVSDAARKLRLRTKRFRKPRKAAA